MTLGEAVYQMIHDMINTTVYSSAAGPDVDNYAKLIYQDPGLIQIIDTEIQRVTPDPNQEATGGDGEYEDILADEINNSFNDEAELAMSDKEYENFMSQKIPSYFEQVSEKGGAGLVKNALSGAQSPMAMVAPLMGILPRAALVLLAISLAPLIISEFKKPGSTLDVRWRRIMELEFNAMMSRQDQWNAQIGIRQVYVQSFDGFLVGNGAAFTESNLRQVRESDQRIADRLDFTDHAKEFFR